MDTRKESLQIPIDQIPFVMRAIGFYPSEQEVSHSYFLSSTIKVFHPKKIENMLNEVRFSKYVDTGTYVTDIDLGDFIKSMLLFAVR